MNRKIAWCWVLLLVSGAAWPASLETLFMPDKVIQGHAKTEEDCQKCHEPFSKTTQNSLCLDCHKKVAADIKEHHGYHGRNETIEKASCNRCHTDHKGRSADIVQLNVDTFQHDLTDYPLKGAHAAVRCQACHVADKKYRDAPIPCVACHKKVSPHKDRLGDKCADCHTEKDWKPKDFDHDKTKFALKGKHTKVACASCHAGERYKDTPKECISCHLINDVHSQRYGKKCAQCHSAKDWKTIAFDHDADTKYKLTGGHKRAACMACHLKPLFTVKTPTVCIECHKKDDEHKGRYGDKCAKCHDTERWRKTAFDHDKDTEFKLRNRHTKLTCVACHKGTIEKGAKVRTCYACHQQEDVHKGQEGQQCERCHGDKGWRVEVRFEHDITRFPLVGLHAPLPCEECHLQATYKGLKIECDSCHHNKDVHKEKLGKACEQCHNPNSWSLWRFDHDKQTDYVLEGKHKGLDCLSCHTVPTGGKVKLTSACVACHRKDDIHRGGFGDRCERCHGVDSFAKLRMQK